MSINLPIVDLSSASVGTSGKIKLPNLGLNNPLGREYPANIMLFNESGCGLQLDFSSDSRGTTLPAGAWVPYSLNVPSTTEVKWTVLYIIPNAQVSTLFPVFYYPGEPVEKIIQIGNSPVAVGGTVNLANQTLVNMTDPIVPDDVINVGNSTDGVLIKFRNDGTAIFSVHRTGGVHTGINVSSTVGVNPVVIGQSGDTSEVLGNLKVDQQIMVSAGFGLTLSTGSISRISTIRNVSVINGKTSVNPGTGAVADMVFITIRASAASTLICAYDPSTLTATNIDIWANGAGSVDVTTIKF